MKIGVFGSAGGTNRETEELAERVGSEIAKQGHALITGGCGGLPHRAALAAQRGGGKTLAFSPGRNPDEHVKLHNFPTEGYTDFVFLPENFLVDILTARKIRNVMSCDACDAGIIIGGRIGTLNEFTILFDMGKVIGVLEGTGGVTKYVGEVVKAAEKETGAMLIYHKEPESLVKEVIEQVKKNESK